MHALISPEELTQTGCRIADVAAATFDVASPLYWVECQDNVKPDLWYYDPSVGTCVEIVYSASTTEAN